MTIRMTQIFYQSAGFYLEGVSKKGTFRRENMADNYPDQEDRQDDHQDDQHDDEPQSNHSSGGGQHTGTVAKWLDRGFGFISPDDGSGDIFCHSSGLQDQGDRDFLNKGEKVTYDLEEDERSNRMRAGNVVGDGSGEPPEPRENNYSRRDNRGGDSRRGGRSGGFRSRGGDRGGDDRGGDRGGRGRGFRGDRNSGGGVCFQWRDYGNCRFGDDCKFAHGDQS